MLEKAENIRVARSKEVDEWIQDQVIQPYLTATDIILQSADKLQEVVDEYEGSFSLVDLRRHASYLDFVRLVNAQVTDVTDGIIERLRSIGHYFHSAGISDAALMLAWQLQHDLSTEELQQLIIDDISGPARGELRYPGSALGARFSGVAGALTESMSEKVAKKIVLSRTRTPKLSPIIQSVVGQGAIWLVNMSSIALWSTFQGGIFQTMNSLPWAGRWMWVAQLDHRTCISCVALHGTIHEANEELFDHPNGRCMALPLAGGPAVSLAQGEITVARDMILTPSTTSGLDWFRSQAKSLQLEILGPKAYNAWQKGQIALPDLSVQHHHPLYGSIMKRGSVKQALG